MHTADQVAAAEGRRWTEWLILFLRVMAGVAMLKGLYHWAQLLGIGQGPGSAFELRPVAWRAATIYFAVLDLVAAVGLWLAAAWGGVVWLTAAISMAALEQFFPQVFGGRVWVVVAEVAAITAYFALTAMASRERGE
jgi:hypothetical protein